MFAVQISFAIPLFAQTYFHSSPIFMAAQGEFPPDMAHTADLRLPQPIWLKKIAAKCTKSHMRLKVTIYEPWALFFLKNKASPFTVLLNAGNPHRNLDSCVEFPAALISWHHQSSYFRQNQVH